MISDEHNDVVFVGVHLVVMIFGIFGVGDDIMIEGLDVGEGEELRLDAIANVGTFHEELGGDLIALVEVLL